jgi:hypothetical protein
MGIKKKNSIDSLAHNLVFMGSEEGCKIVEDMLKKISVECHRRKYGGNKKIHQGGKGRIKSSF